MALQIVIMAAGQGTRMKSSRPKVLHTLGGSSLLQHVLRLAAALGPTRTVVVTGHGAELVEAEVAAVAAATQWGDPGADLRCVRQWPQRGTGHAVQQALPQLDPDTPTTLVLNGDVPLVQRATASDLAAACGGEALALLTVNLADPTGYGRIVRDEAGNVRAIVEHRDASDAQRNIQEVYTGILAAPTARLADWVMALRDDNAQGELYLTDIVAQAVAQGVAVRAVPAHSETEVLGVNSPAQLAALERRLQRRHADAALDQGVRLADPDRFDVRGQLVCGRDVEIDVGCIFEGEVTLGDGVRVGAHCVLRNTQIAAGAVIHPFSHLEGARVGPGALVGPYARLRPGAELAADVHIGNFVEVKNAKLARGAKANHLAYLGDASVGERVNFGAGSITANYDGVNKHRSVIGNDVHVGSNCVLIAPITVGDGATIGAGSTVALKVPAGELTLSRAPVRTIKGWTRPARKG